MSPTHVRAELHRFCQNRQPWSLPCLCRYVSRLAVPVPDTPAVVRAGSFTPEQFADAATTLGGWLAEGKLHDENTVLEGFDQIPTAILGLFSGANTGKMLVRQAVETPKL